MVTKNDTVALAAAATVAAVAAGYGIHRANATRGRGGSSAVATTVLVFRDRCDEGSGADVDGGGGLSPNAMAFKCHPSPPRSPATGGLSQDLRAAAARDLGDGASSADGVRLFLHSTGVEVDAYSDDATVLRLLREESSTNGLSVPVLICTFEGKELSKKASNLTLEKFPRPTSGIDLPFGLGYVRSFTKGKREIPGFNGYENLLRENQSSVKTVRIRRFPYRVDDRLNQEHYGIDYKPQEDEGLVLTVDPRMVSEMLHRQRDFPKMWSSAQERGVKEFVESGGLFTDSTTSPAWETAHGVLPKYFNAIRIQNYYPTILEKTQAFAKEWAKLAAGGGVGGRTIPDATDWLTCMTADAVIKASMDYDMRNVERKGAGEDLHRFLVSFRAATAYLQSGKLPDAPGPKGEEFRRNKQVCKDVVADITEATRNGEIGGPLSFVTGMLETKSAATGNYIALKDFWGHAINVMVAGHETTASTLGFCLAELSRHPECLDKAVKEIESVMGDRSSPNYDDIGKLIYIDACFRETLRLFPPVQFLKRECANDTIVLGKYLLRKGRRIETLTYGLHRDPEQWDQGLFGDPEVFNPERHIPGAPARHPNAMAPFGFGIRACIGMQFALLEAKTFLCMMLHLFTIKTPPGFEPVPTGLGGAPKCKNLTFIIKPRPGGPLTRINIFPEN